MISHFIHLLLSMWFLLLVSTLHTLVVAMSDKPRTSFMVIKNNLFLTEYAWIWIHYESPLFFDFPAFPFPLTKVHLVSGVAATLQSTDSFFLVTVGKCHTVDSHYNELLGTRKSCLLFITKPCYIRVTKTIQYKGNLKLGTAQIIMKVFISARYNECPM